MPIPIKASRQALFDIVQPDIEQWAIYRLNQDRDAFLDDMTRHAAAHLRRLTGNDHKRLMDEIARTMYLERTRIKEEPWRVDPPDEKAFWDKVNGVLVEDSLKKPFEGETEAESAMFNSIVRRYSEEIMGSFKVWTYKLATLAVPWAMQRLLNAASAHRILYPKIKLHDRLKVTGNLDLIRKLSLKGTLLLTPTHFSNLDSPLVGWIINSLGLPAFLYGGGLNLFNSQFFGFFMSRLGCYKVDRRKKNMLYIETLKTYSQLSLQRNCHNLFFPGGTRSRTGQIEKHLKLGLLGSAMEAQRLNFVQAASPDTAGKIFVLPLVINYHFVLEAGSLIEQHLRQSGKERYFVEPDHFPSFTKFINFLWKFFAARSEAILSFGEPMDVFGNRVDEEGKSCDANGIPIDISKHFMSDGQYQVDYQRDNEYTRMLGESIVQQFYKYNTVLASHLVAFVAFEMLSRKHRRMDLYGLLRLPEEERIIPYTQFVPIVERLRNEIVRRSQCGELQVADYMHGDIGRIIEYGCMHLGVYHTKRPLKLVGDEKDVVSESLHLLYYYRNRLMGYGLELEI